MLVRLKLSMGNDGRELVTVYSELLDVFELRPKSVETNVHVDGLTRNNFSFVIQHLNQ